MKLGPKGDNLVFLISQPRAGSTLLQLTLSGHPDIATTSEPWIALHLIYALRSKGISTEYNSESARLALLDFLKQSGVDEEFYKKQVANFLLTFYNQSLTHQNKNIFLDKTPRYSLIVSDLIELFPNAKFIILIRNPLAVLSSIFRTWIKDDLTMLGEFRNDLMVAPLNLVNALNQYPDRCFKVKYEDFVTNPEKSVNNICNFLEIPFFKGMLNYSDRVKSEWKFGDPVGVHKSNVPKSSSLNVWEKGFDSEQKKQFALSYLKSLGPQLIDEMGYNYNELENSIKKSVGSSKKPLISWSTIMSDLEGFSQIYEIRKLFHRLLLDNKISLKSKTNSDKIPIDPEWEEIFKILVIEAKSKLVQPLIAQNSIILNSYSWKITAPLRALARLLKGTKGDNFQ